ncbi:unnamed protein product (macronuclear) [Paramecium tetraurelia]|uniref:Protein kinase domain-containing protein n=1 Tax=Paramecium tetraurelia TaxID=5888 RepID=A0D5V0_PARTE|nr:uncharacterized protein GSPATT00013847001 [Paramecium tetraurelia]CAK78417.1 unnamed protein product [Paramecium tetraurelia]|eukprot:XP_001445814.1 hypothetical protein (macronuclear) [Paramecium tetraurelia strain d4-2]
MIIDAPNQQFPNRKFQTINQLGKGAQGQVYLVKSINWGINDSKQFAIKQQPKFNENELQILNMIMNYQKGQFNQASQVIRIYEILQYNNKAYLIMETGEQDLYSYIESYQQQQQQLSLDQKIKIMKQLSQSIYFFHETLKLIHRDIKPENFIKVGDDFKLIDFGLAKPSQDFFMTQNVGTPYFQAPEIIQNKQDYTCAVDVWSLGCVFYELCKSQLLFQANTIQEIQNIVLNFNQKYLEDKLSSDEMPQSLKYLLIQMIQPNPKDRLSIKEVLSKLNQISTEQFGNQYNNSFIVQNVFQKNNQQFQQQNNFPQINQQISFNPQIQQQKQQQQQQQQQLKDQDQKQIEQNTLIQQIITILEKQNLQQEFKNLQDQQDKYQQRITEYIQLFQNQFETNLNDLKNEFKDQNIQQIKVQNNNNENLTKVMQEYKLNIKDLDLKNREQDMQIKELNLSIFEFKTKIQEQNNQINIFKDKEQAQLQLDQYNKELIQKIEKYKFNEMQQQMKQSQLQKEIQDQQISIEQYENNIKKYQEEQLQLNQLIYQQKSQENIFQNTIQENEKRIQQCSDIIQDQKIQLEILNKAIQNSNQIKELENKFQIQINKILDQQLQCQKESDKQQQKVFAELNSIKQSSLQLQQNQQELQKDINRLLNVIQQYQQQIQQQEPIKEKSQIIDSLKKEIQLHFENVKRNPTTICQVLKSKIYLLFEEIKKEISFIIQNIDDVKLQGKYLVQESYKYNVNMEKMIANDLEILKGWKLVFTDLQKKFKK